MTDALELRSAWRRHLRSTSTPDLRVGVAATFTVGALEAFVGGSLLRRSFSPSVRVAPFNQVVQTLLDPEAAFHEVPEVRIFLPRLDELVARQLAEYCTGVEGALDDALDVLEDTLGSALARHRHEHPGTVLVGTFPFPTMPECDPLSFDSAAITFLDRANTWLRGRVAELAGVEVLDVFALQATSGISATTDRRAWLLYRQPFHDSFLLTLAAQAARLIEGLRRAPQKCAVLDCDNTLWGGVVGEAGIKGVHLGDDFPGNAFQELQRLVKSWRARGVLLALCSQNNLADVREMFEKHPAMVLAPDDIAVWAVDWRPKAEKMPEIAEALSIGIDSLVFIDDSGFEIESVRAQHPAVRCIKIPDDPELMVSALQSERPFDSVRVTDDDRERAGRVHQERLRQRAQESLSHGEFLAQLELRVSTRPLDDTTLARAVQLVNKTNQFNLTTMRTTEAEMAHRLERGDDVVCVANVDDRFGSYGLTALAIAEPRGDHWDLSAFLLSCRVMGRGVEQRFLGDVARAIVARGGDRIRAVYLPTARNAPCADFLRTNGFAERDGAWWHSAHALAEHG